MRESVDVDVGACNLIRCVTPPLRVYSLGSATVDPAGAFAPSSPAPAGAVPPQKRMRCQDFFASVRRARSPARTGPAKVHRAKDGRLSRSTVASTSIPSSRDGQDRSSSLEDALERRKTWRPRRRELDQKSPVRTVNSETRLGNTLVSNDQGVAWRPHPCLTGQHPVR